MYRTLIGRSRRVVFLDELRGLCLILMILYHGLYDLTYIFGRNIPFRSLPLNMLQLFICCNFIFISGISSRFSRSNIKRGAVVLGVGIVMSLVTWFFMPEQVVVFGILHLLGICMILHGLIFRKKQVEWISPLAGIIVCGLLFAFTWGVSSGYVGFFGLWKVFLPQALYRFYALSPIGFLSPDFFSSDYFPLLPWMFLFFAGSFLGVPFRDNDMPEFFYKKHIPFLGAVGKHTMIVYVLHQPVLYGLLTLVFQILGRLGLAA